MSPLRYPWLRAQIGTAAGWSVYLLLRALFALPKPGLLGVLRALERIVRALAGEGPAVRAVADLRWLLQRGDTSALVIRRLATQSRAEEIVSIVRGALIRSLP